MVLPSEIEKRIRELPRDTEIVTLFKRNNDECMIARPDATIRRGYLTNDYSGHRHSLNRKVLATMHEITKLLATFCCGVFFGAALYISLVQHPAAVETGTDFAGRFFRPMYRRAAILQDGREAYFNSGNFESHSATFETTRHGWPAIMSRLKSLLEVGSPLPFQGLKFGPSSKEPGRL